MTATFDPQSVTDFGYNTCVEIIDPYEFAKALTEEIYQMVNYGVIEACEYFNRSAPYHGHDGWRPQILKDTHYAHQKEVRILWDPWNHKRIEFPLIPKSNLCLSKARRLPSFVGEFYRYPSHF